MGFIHSATVAKPSYLRDLELHQGDVRAERDEERKALLGCVFVFCVALFRPRVGCRSDFAKSEYASHTPISFVCDLTLSAALNVD